MNIRTAYDAGYAAALTRFKLANIAAGPATHAPSLGGGPSNASQSPSVAMPMAIPKPSTPTTAPVAAGASKANVIG